MTDQTVGLGIRLYGQGFEVLAALAGGVEKVNAQLISGARKVAGEVASAMQAAAAVPAPPAAKQAVAGAIADTKAVSTATDASYAQIRTSIGLVRKALTQMIAAYPEAAAGAQTLAERIAKIPLATRVTATALQGMRGSLLSVAGAMRKEGTTTVSALEAKLTAAEAAAAATVAGSAEAAAAVTAEAAAATAAKQAQVQAAQKVIDAVRAEVVATQVAGEVQAATTRRVIATLGAKIAAAQAAGQATIQVGKTTFTVAQAEIALTEAVKQRQLEASKVILAAMGSKSAAIQKLGGLYLWFGDTVRNTLDKAKANWKEHTAAQAKAAQKSAKTMQRGTLSTVRRTEKSARAVDISSSAMQGLLLASSLTSGSLIGVGMSFYFMRRAMLPVMFTIAAVATAIMGLVKVFKKLIDKINEAGRAAQDTILHFSALAKSASEGARLWATSAWWAVRYGYAIDDVRAAMDTLWKSGLATTEMLKSTIEFSAAWNMELAEGANILAQAVGKTEENTESLREYGIVIDGVTEGTSRLAVATLVAEGVMDRFGGTAESRLNTIAGAAKRVGAAIKWFWEVFTEPIATGVIAPVLNAVANFVISLSQLVMGLWRSARVQKIWNNLLQRARQIMERYRPELLLLANIVRMVVVAAFETLFKVFEWGLRQLEKFLGWVRRVTASLQRLGLAIKPVGDMLRILNQEWKEISFSELLARAKELIFDLPITLGGLTFTIGDIIASLQRVMKERIGEFIGVFFGALVAGWGAKALGLPGTGIGAALLVTLIDIIGRTFIGLITPGQEEARKSLNQIFDVGVWAMILGPLLIKIGAWLLGRIAAVIGSAVLGGIAAWSGGLPAGVLILISLGIGLIVGALDKEFNTGLHGWMGDVTKEFKGVWKNFWEDLITPEGIDFDTALSNLVKNLGEALGRAWEGWERPAVAAGGPAIDPGFVVERPGLKTVIERLWAKIKEWWREEFERFWREEVLGIRLPKPGEVEIPLKYVPGAITEAELAERFGEGTGLQQLLDDIVEKWNDIFGPSGVITTDSAKVDPRVFGPIRDSTTEFTNRYWSRRMRDIDNSYRDTFGRGGKLATTSGNVDAVVLEPVRESFSTFSGNPSGWFYDHFVKPTIELWDSVFGPEGAFASTAGDAQANIIDPIVDWFTAFKDVTWPGIMDAIGDPWTFLFGDPDTGKEGVIARAFATMVNALRTKWDEIKGRLDPIVEFFEGIISKIAEAISAVTGFIATWAGKLIGVEIQLPEEPPETQYGGVFRFPQVRTIAEAGPEAVIPLRGGAVPVTLTGGMGGGISVSVVVTGNTIGGGPEAADELAEIVASRIVRKLRPRGALATGRF